MSIAWFAGAGLLAVLLTWLVAKKIRHGSSCCGEREGPVKKIPVKDKNPAHYPYRYRVGIDGMVCGNCVRTVENAFRRAGDIFAVANLATKEVEVHAKRPLKREDILELLSDTSYTVINFKEENG